MLLNDDGTRVTCICISRSTCSKLDLAIDSDIPATYTLAAEATGMLRQSLFQTRATAIL